MIAFVVAVTLTQASGYVRSRVDDADVRSQCLWWKERTNIIWNQNSQGTVTVAGDGEFEAVERSFASWQTQLTGCGNVTLTQGPRTSNRQVTYNEKGTNENVVLFRTRRCNELVDAADTCWTKNTCANTYDCWEHSQTAIGVTTSTYNPNTGEVVDADIELNDTRATSNRGFLFTVNDGLPCAAGLESQSCIATDIQNTMTHEVGHLLGLSHSTAVGSTMAADAKIGETNKRSIDRESLNFVCETYPKGQASQVCVLKVTTSSVGETPYGCGCGAGDALGLMVLATLGGLRRKRSWI